METMTIDPNQHDRFVMRQRIRAMINQYEITVPGDDGEPGEPVCFVEQARMKFKEDIRFYSDDARTVELLRLKARQRFDPRARYDITDDRGTKIGEIQKVFGESLMRSTYRLYDPSGEELATARERNVAIALFRRLVGFIPYVGDVRPQAVVAAVGLGAAGEATRRRDEDDLRMRERQQRGDVAAAECVEHAPDDVAVTGHCGGGCALRSRSPDPAAV